jgi:hypothetical protein
VPYSSFAQFGAALCEVAGTTAPPLQPDQNGLTAFHLVMRDVVVNLAHLMPDEGASDDVLVMATFGPIPQEMELEVLRALAQSNFSMLGPRVPVLAVNPATGEVVLRQQLSLSDTEATDAFATILRLGELAREWRLNPTMAPLAPEAASVASVGHHQFA